MDIEPLDFTDARNRMVDSQIRPNKVTDPRILSAMRQLPRERFLPPELRTRAYVDEDVPLGGGRVLMEPLVIARLVQLLAPGAGERALVVGAGVGYGAALLAGCGVRVTALEEEPTLAELAKSTLADLAPGVSVVVGPLAAGWKSGAPYDLVLIEGAVADIPDAIAAQLRADTGRLVTVRVPKWRDRLGRARRADAVRVARPADVRLRDRFVAISDGKARFHVLTYGCRPGVWGRPRLGDGWHGGFNLEIGKLGLVRYSRELAAFGHTNRGRRRDHFAVGDVCRDGRCVRGGPFGDIVGDGRHPCR